MMTASDRCALSRRSASGMLDILCICPSLSVQGRAARFLPPQERRIGPRLACPRRGAALAYTARTERMSAGGHHGRG